MLKQLYLLNIVQSRMQLFNELFSLLLKAAYIKTVLSVHIQHWITVEFQHVSIVIHINFPFSSFTVF